LKIIYLPTDHHSCVQTIFIDRSRENRVINNRSRLFPSDFVLTTFRRNVRFHNLIIKNIHLRPCYTFNPILLPVQLFFLRSLVIYTTRSILSGNPSLVRSFLVFLSKERSLNSVYIYLSTVARGSQHDISTELYAG